MWSFGQALPVPSLELRVCNAPSPHARAGSSPPEASFEPAKLQKPVAASADVPEPAYNAPWLHARADRQPARTATLLPLPVPAVPAEPLAPFEPALGYNDPSPHVPEGRLVALVLLPPVARCAQHAVPPLERQARWQPRLQAMPA